MLHVRQPAVAGTFYPGRASELAFDIDSMLEAAVVEPHEPVPKALVVPHAGYVYSGPIAASAYVRLRPAASRLRRVVLLGPAHREYVRGLVLPASDAFDTPLGRVPLDTETMERLGLPRSESAHLREHSLEVQLPFLLRVLPHFELIPIAVGDADIEEVASVIDSLWGGPETVVVISSDLSHYLPYAVGRAEDTKTAAHIVQLDVPLDHDHACGATPINGLLVVAKRRGLSCKLLDLRSSGDTAGDRGRVVGYGAFGLYEGRQHDA